MLCSICNSLQQPLTEKGEEQAVRQKENLAWDDLERSSETCYCCKVFLEGCARCMEQHDIRISDVKAFDISLAFSYTPYPKSELEKDHEDWPRPESWVDFPTGIRTSAETGSAQAFGKVLEWLTECEQEHEDCRQRSELRLPTRVLDVGLDDGIIRLHESSDESGKYTALSHCWGSIQILTTTKETLDDRKEGIPSEHLSKTFSEAIEITRRLGIKYIWIDSLCIIQDDKADWLNEASKMADVYRNAYLTIAATRSAGGDGGLFTSTPDLEVSGSTPTDEGYRIIFREQIKHVRMHESDDDRCPLFCRGWCYQERLLSTRVLHFGPQELFFECLTESQCECGGIYGHEIALPRQKLAYAKALYCSNMYYVAKVWRTMVLEYCDLSFTFKNDKLPALGSAARQVADKRKSRYLAGLWEDSIIKDLFWEGFGWTKKRYSPWRAPTWSWASIEGLVYYKDAPLTWSSTESSEGRSEHDLIPSSQMVSCEITPAGADEFGELQSAVLTLSGDCFDALLTYDPRAAAESYYSAPAKKITFWLTREDTAPFEMMPDYNLASDDTHYAVSATEVVCIRLSRSKGVYVSQQKPIVHRYLVLRLSKSQQGHYERIGSIEIDKQQTLDEKCLTRRSVSII
ncbi:HET-domain-containing protein [Rhizodiscina lignyota]|uniref:HET-domain-containing protein n=1 Tax=Rhizodiscina lignyota TaxID=1504668 RepID=A0A9P4I7V3_9PEZI|nr:HET-domain-containing protein [Rhizodiscina lignyota]